MSIVLSAASSASNLPSSVGSERAQHTVQPAESLIDIANQYGVTPGEILKANPQVSNADMIYPGDGLVIPARVSSSTSEAISISGGDLGASQSARTDARSAYTSDAGTVHQSSASASGNVGVDPEAGSVRASGGVAFNESIKSANGYGVSFGAGANASVSGGVHTADGVTTYQATTDVSVFLKGGVNTPQAGVEIGRTEGIRASYQVAMPADADVSPASVNPFEPHSMPVGSQVTMSGADYTANEFKATFRNIASQTKVTDESGVSTVIARTGEDTVRVTAGPSEAVKVFNGIGADFGMLSVTLGRNESLTGTTLRNAEFDLSSDAGQAAYNDFLVNGVLPSDNGPGVSGVTTVESLRGNAQSSISGQVGALDLSADIATSASSIVVTTHADGTVERSMGFQYGHKAPMSVVQRFDAAGNEQLDARQYNYEVNVDRTNVHLLNAALTGSFGGGAVREGQTVTLGFSEQQMHALNGQAAQAVENGSNHRFAAVFGYVNRDGSRTGRETSEFALAMGRAAGTDGVPQHLFEIAKGSGEQGRYGLVAATVTPNN